MHGLAGVGAAVLVALAPQQKAALLVVTVHS